MPNAIFPTYKAAALNPGVDLVNGFVGSGSAGAPTAATPRAVLVTSAYVYSAAHQFQSSLAGTVGTAQPLLSRTNALGVFDAADITFTTVAAGSTCNAIVLYMDTGTPATSRLIAYIDTLTGSVAMSIATNGGDITIAWDNGVNRIFAL